MSSRAAFSWPWLTVNRKTWFWRAPESPHLFDLQRHDWKPCPSPHLWGAGLAFHRHHRFTLSSPLSLLPPASCPSARATDIAHSQSLQQSSACCRCRRADSHRASPYRPAFPFRSSPADLLFLEILPDSGSPSAAPPAA